MAQIIPLTALFERLSAKTKRFAEVIVFVHHYGGHKYSFKRHIQWVNELGYDAVTFNLPLSEIYDIRLRSLPFSNDWAFGLRHVWADKIETVLGHLPEKKIIYSFSSPSAAVLSVLAKRNAIDIKAWICDGGPFIDFSRGIENYLAHKNLFLLNNLPKLRRISARLVSWAMGSDRYGLEMATALSSLPPNLPILSLRAKNDPLVSVDMIEQFFALTDSTLALTKVDLLMSGHLTGFKDEPDFYKKSVGDFLSSLRTDTSG